MESHIENHTDQSKSILNSLRLISLNQSIPFCCVVNQSTIAYIAGRSLVMQNIRTLQQSILWVGQSYYEIINVSKNLVSYGPIRIALMLKNNYQKIYEMVVFSIDWNNYFYRKRHEKYIKLPQILVTEDQDVPLIQFDSTGQRLFMYTDEKNCDYLTIFNCFNGKEIFKRTLKDRILFMRAFSHKNQHYLALLLKKELVIMSNNGQIITQCNKIYTQVLGPDQQVIQIQLYENHPSKLMGFILTNLGNLIMFKINENTIEGLFKIDIRAHQSTMNLLSQSHQGSQNSSKQVSRMTTIKFIADDDSQQIPIAMPTAFMVHGNRIVIGYQNSRKLIYITFSLLNYTSYSVYSTQNQVYFPNQIADEHEHLKDKDITIRMISLSNDLCTGGLVVCDQDGYIYIMVMDVLNSLMASERKINTGSRIFGNFSCKGVCNSVAYSERESSLFLLHENKRGHSYLMYYLVSCSEIAKQNPSQVQMWDEPLKNKAYKISVHPSNYSLLIIYDQVTRLHYYTRQKLFESHVTFHLSNCQTGGFSPLGDKIVLGNSCGLFVINAYTYEVFSIINPVSMLNKVPRQMEFTSPFDMVVQFYSGNSSYLAQVSNYKKVRFLGQLQMVNSNTVSTTSASTETQISSIQQRERERSNFKTIQIDLKRKIIIMVIPGHQIRFYNLQMQILNILSIQTECVNLYQQIQVLLVGTTKGSVLIFRWPQIVDKVTNIRAIDAQVIALHNVHKDRIMSMKMSLNYRYIFVVSESGQLNVLQFLQENSINISRHGALVMLKKSNIKPLMNECLTSISDQTKRTETIVKAVGKEVQINKRNQKIYQQLIDNLHDHIKQQKIKTEIVIKDELELSQEQKKIRNLIRKMEMIKNQLLELGNKKQQELIKQKQQFDIRLRKLFEEKGTYQQILKQKQQKFNKLKYDLLAQQYTQLQDTNYAQQTQLKLIETGSATNKKINQKIQMYNKGELIKMQETKTQSLMMINHQYKQELIELNEKKNQLQLSIRKYTFNISEMATKNNKFGLHLMEMENDLDKISKFRPERLKNMCDVEGKLTQVKIRNEELVIQHRQLQFNKQQSEKKAKVIENFHKSLQEDIHKLQTMFNEIKNKKLQLDDQFYEENRRKIFLSSSIKEMKDKIIQLKKIRNKIKQQSTLKSKKLSRSLYNSEQNKQNIIQNKAKIKCLNKSYHNNMTHIITNNERSLQIVDDQQYSNNFKGTTASIQTSTIDDANKTLVSFRKSLYKIGKKRFEENVNNKNQGIQYDQILQRRNQACQKLDKLNRIKNEKIKKYKLINQKLINDHKRLISQLNQLKRYNDFLLKKEQKLKLQIKNGCLDIKERKSLNETFQNNSSIISYKIKPKNISNSTHIAQTTSKNNNSSAIVKTRIRKSGFVSLHRNGKINVNDQRFITEQNE